MTHRSKGAKIGRSGYCATAVEANNFHRHADIGWRSRMVGGTIRSVQRQLYPHWELCLAIGHSLPESLFTRLHALAGQGGKIRIAQVEDPATWAGKVNAALKLASGDFVALVGPGDALSEHALYWAAKELVAFPRRI